VLDERVYFIDFGLGEKCSEDEIRGVDLHLLMEAFSATHRNPQCFDWVMQGYKNLFGDTSLIEKKIEDISKRGRYTRSSTIT
jgi:tRNA A-37 threonylcarbamoyl transferase component Bud32